MSNDLIDRDRDWHPAALTPAYRSTQLRAPKLALQPVERGAGELTGPVFGHSILTENDHDLVTNHAVSGATALGERIILHGRVMDENACAIPNTLVEIWQANAGGRYRHVNDGYIAPLDPNFGGCGRTLTADDGSYRFFTIKPGAYPWPNGGNDWRPAHIHFSVFGPAFAQRLITQCYFEGDPLIARCPIANTITNPRALDMLVARLDMEVAVPLDCLAYRFDIVLRGHVSTRFESKLEGN